MIWKVDKLLRYTFGQEADFACAIRWRGLLAYYTPVSAFVSYGLLTQVAAQQSHPLAFVNSEAAFYEHLSVTVYVVV